MSPASGPATSALVATESEILSLDPGSGTLWKGTGVDGRPPTCLSMDPHGEGRMWAGTHDGGVLRSDDAGRSWQVLGLVGQRIMSIAASAAEPDLLWVGTEPSAVWRSDDAGRKWEKLSGLDALPSSSEWAFPPKPETHHVRWIATHPHEAGRLWVAIEAGALISTPDGGRSWRDRVDGGPYDTHELALHREAPDRLRVAAGDGYYESDDGGSTWRAPRRGLEVGYLRSVAIDPGDPDVVLVSASSRARSAYVAGRADGRLYRREGSGAWERVRAGWPDPPATIAPLLRPGTAAGELWAADERGVHRSTDGGRTWEQVARYARAPSHLRGFEVGALALNG